MKNACKEVFTDIKRTVNFLYRTTRSRWDIKRIRITKRSKFTIEQRTTKISISRSSKFVSQSFSTTLRKFVTDCPLEKPSSFLNLDHVKSYVENESKLSGLIRITPFARKNPESTKNTEPVKLANYQGYDNHKHPLVLARNLSTPCRNFAAR